MDEKRCSRCGEIKSIALFSAHSAHRDRLQSACKFCMHENNLRWQRENPERHRARNATWQRANPEKKRESANKRRAIKRNAIRAHINPRDWSRLVRRYHNSCAYCGINSDAMQQDHIIPLSRGGHHTIGNVLPACPTCNQSKNARLLVEWRRTQRPLSTGYKG